MIRVGYGTATSGEKVHDQVDHQKTTGNVPSPRSLFISFTDLEFGLFSVHTVDLSDLNLFHEKEIE